jgi:hypothetical protein
MLKNTRQQAEGCPAGSRCLAREKPVRKKEDRRIH